MEAILMTVEMGDNVIQLSDSGIVDDLPLDGDRKDDDQKQKNRRPYNQPYWQG